MILVVYFFLVLLFTGFYTVFRNEKGCRTLGCFVILLSFILAGLWVWTEYSFLQEMGRLV